MKYSLLLSLLLFAGSTCAFSNAIFIRSPTQPVYAGQTFAVDIDIDYIVDLNSVGFTLNFDPTLVAADGIVEGPLFTAAAAANNDFTIPAWNIVSPGSIAYADVLALGSTLDGPGTIAIADFTAIGSGTSSISFAPDTVMLSNPTGFPISVLYGSGPTVVAAPVAEPATLYLLATALGLMLFGMWRRSKTQLKGGAATIHF